MSINIVLVLIHETQIMFTKCITENINFVNSDTVKIYLKINKVSLSYKYFRFVNVLYQSLKLLNLEIECLIILIDFLGFMPFEFFLFILKYNS